MSNSQLKLERIKLGLYSSLKSVIECLDDFKLHSQSLESLQNNLDNEHPNNYLKLTKPIIRDLYCLRLNIGNAKQNLEDYRLLQTQTQVVQKPIKSSSKAENDTLFIEQIEIIALPQENGRWACAINGIKGIPSLLIYADTKQKAISTCLRQLATKIELK